MGLIPTVEGTVARQWYDALIQQVEETIDVGRIFEIASGAGVGATEQAAESFPAEPERKRAVIAVAQDRAFSFYYQDSLEPPGGLGSGVGPVQPPGRRKTA